MEDFEKLEVFYLGRQYDLNQKRRKGGFVLYDSKDLLTHAVCVGMTGSGKTGLCISLLEEAAIDGIPSIVIDPKGDLPNLLLTFPQLRGEDFGPWINEDDARIKGVSPDEYARQQADLWKKGLAEWGQDGERIKRLREALDLEKFPADEAIYADLPSEAGKVKSYGIWSRSFADWLFRNQKIELFRSPSLKTLSKPNESERDFRIRLREASREESSIS